MIAVVILRTPVSLDSRRGKRKNTEQRSFAFPVAGPTDTEHVTSKNHEVPKTGLAQYPEKDCSRSDFSSEFLGHRDNLRLVQTTSQQT